jgi:hypothetical protein
MPKAECARRMGGPVHTFTGAQPCNAASATAFRASHTLQSKAKYEPNA